MTLYGTLAAWCSVDRLYLSWLCTWNHRGEKNHPIRCLILFMFLYYFKVQRASLSPFPTFTSSLLIYSSILFKWEMWEESGEQKGCHLLLDLNKAHFRPQTLWLKSSWGSRALPIELKFGAAAKTRFLASNCSFQTKQHACNVYHH